MGGGLERDAATESEVAEMAIKGSPPPFPQTIPLPPHAPPPSVPKAASLEKKACLFWLDLAARSMKESYHTQAAENAGYEAVGTASVEVLGRIWGSLAPVLNVPEATALRLAVAECCLAGTLCSRGVALATTELCCPAVAHLVDLEHGVALPPLALGAGRCRVAGRCSKGSELVSIRG